jgi:hypothetical protein
MNLLEAKTFMKIMAFKYIGDRKLRRIKHYSSRQLMGGNLSALADYFGTDKNSLNYTQHYQLHFRPFRDKKINLLEIGIGGYDNPWDGGHSLRMWKSFFTRASIFGLDVINKSPHDDFRIKTIKGSQTDEELLAKLAEEVGGFDIVIDDGSHLNEHVITSFRILFPLLRLGGIYAIEDLCTSYWESHPKGVPWGGSKNLEAQFTSMNFLKRLVDGLNHEEYAKHTKPHPFSRYITSMHFYHNLAFIYKGSNQGGGCSSANPNTKISSLE